jgi:murein DD-endopeptidase MepM/ murein hydrolase activator NlpD
LTDSATGLPVALQGTVRPSAIILVLDVLLVGCGSSPTSPDPLETCEGFGDWQTSPYVLPYAVGSSFIVDQSNCSPPGNGHRGVTKFGYDFLMPIGTPIYAARAGLVTEVEESHRQLPHAANELP